MLQRKLATVEEITEYVKIIIDHHCQYPSRAKHNVEKLELLFNADAYVWKEVIQDEKFNASFINALGKRRMKVLKKMLYRIDKAHFKNISFGDEGE